MIISFRPKFMTDETIKQASKSVATCSRCHSERVLPPWKVAIIGLCAACCLELEYDLKKAQGRLREGEERPRRLNRGKLSPQRQISANKEIPEVELEGKN